MASVDEFLIDAFQNEYLNEFSGNEGDGEFQEIPENELELLTKGRIRENHEKELVGLKGNSDRKELLREEEHKLEEKAHYLKEKEDEIRMKLDEFAKELSQVKKQRDGH